MKYLLMLYAMVICPFAAEAQTSEQKIFAEAAREAAFYCELDSSLLNTAVSYSSPRVDEISAKLIKCIVERGNVMTEALKALPANNETSEVRAASKSVYSAWLSYKSVLLEARTDQARTNSSEAIAFKKSLNDLKTEMMLVSP